MNDGNPVQALLDVLGRPDGGGAAPAPLTAVVVTVRPTSSAKVGKLLTASLGDLPLDAADIEFLQHTRGDVNVGERLLVLPIDGGQRYCCMGRFLDNG